MALNFQRQTDASLPHSRVIAEGNQRSSRCDGEARLIPNIRSGASNGNKQKFVDRLSQRQTRMRSSTHPLFSFPMVMRSMGRPVAVAVMVLVAFAVMIVVGMAIVSMFLRR